MDYYTYCNEPHPNLFAASCGVGGVGGVMTKNWSSACARYGDYVKIAAAPLLDSYIVKISLDKVY